MKYFLCLTFVLSVILCLGSSYEILRPFKPSIEVQCVVSQPTTYNRIGNKYYVIGKTKATWHDAFHSCRRFGGDLLLIESAEEMNTISSHLKSLGYDGSAWFWTSGNSLVVKNQFISTINGLPLPFTSWSAGQPDYPDTERCVHLWLQTGEFRMNNWVCEGQAFYICQRQNYSRCTEVY